MQVTVVTSLFPTPQRPHEGIFAQRRWHRLAERGHRVTVVHPVPYCPPLPLGADRTALRRVPHASRDARCEIRHPRYLHIPGSAVGNSARFARRAAAVTISSRPEVVVADYAWPAAAVIPPLAAVGIPGVVSGRGSDLVIAGSDPRLAQRLRRALREAGSWCAVAQHLVELMDELAGRRSGWLVPNGVDMDLFRPRSAPAARSGLGIDPGSRLVLVVGHLIPRKDPFLALAAFAAAQPELGDATLAFIGVGPLQRKLRRRIAAFGLEKRVLLAGEQPPTRLADWFAAADCLLLCSRWEGRPNVVLEALASGRPVLATATAGAAEILAPHPQMLVAERDPRVVSSRLVHLLAAPTDPDLLRASVAALTWDASCDALQECLQRAIREKGRT